MRISARPTGRSLVAALAVGGGLLGWVAVLPRVFRRHRELLLGFNPFKRFLKAYNNLASKISGTEHSSWGLLTHVGRHSGRVYQTSLGAYPYGDGFLLPLAYGTHTDWYQNLMAAGSGTLTWRGGTYWLERPELVSAPEVMRAWPVMSRILLRLAGIHNFVWLHKSRNQGTDCPPVTSPAQCGTG
ncbi:MAG TPA: nitroreductase family deazaflavin-dependent oxidoreductase [Mycobacterium sp.]|nr:nitroreductase family deazaflavin-dependent oxidoreductase [Mycobacterium sp.]HTX97429.1 nitroreductase family deazaflavin-dependent oxidoreductase [Mycobacterium sp.]